jgi:hypothetical protein
VLAISKYPRRRWPQRLGITTLLVSTGLTLGYGIPTGIRTSEVITAEQAAEDTAQANHFWRMVAGVDPIDDTDIGRVAEITRDIGRQPDPIREFLRYYVAPGELPDIEDRLGYNVFEHLDSSRRDTATDQGHFTDKFILDAIQAVGAVDGASYRALIRPAPRVPGYGWLRWEWGVAAIAGVLALSGLLWAWLRRDERRWLARAKARAIAELPDGQLRVYRIIEELEREPHGQRGNELLCQARCLFHDMRKGLDADSTSSKLDTLIAEVAEMADTWRLTRDAYQELSENGAPDSR